LLPIKWISDQIAVSPAFEDKEIKKIKEEGFDAIIDVRSEDHDDSELIRNAGMQCFHVSVDDRYAPTQNQLERILNFVNPLLDQEKKVLIHCQNGYQRSPLVAVTIFVHRGMDVADALGLLKQRFPESSFTPIQEEFIDHLKKI